MIQVSEQGLRKVLYQKVWSWLVRGVVRVLMWLG